MRVALRLTQLSTSNVKTGRVQVANLKTGGSPQLTIETRGTAKIAGFNGVRALVDDHGTFSGGTGNNRIFGQFKMGGVQVLTEQYNPRFRTSVHGVFEAAAPTYGAAFRLALKDDPVFAALGRSNAVNFAFVDVVTSATVKKLGLPARASKLVNARRDNSGELVEVKGLSGLPGFANFKATVSAAGIIIVKLLDTNGQPTSSAIFRPPELEAQFAARIPVASLPDQTIGVLARNPLAAQDLTNAAVALAAEKLGQTPFRVQTPSVKLAAKSLGATVHSFGLDSETAPSTDSVTLDFANSLGDRHVDATLVRDGQTHTTSFSLDELMSRIGVPR